MSLTITMPGRVWNDFLNPLVSGMEAELGLTGLRAPRRKIGRGTQERYEQVSPQVARELADYLHDRAETLLGQDAEDRAEQDTLRAGRKVAANIYGELGVGQ